MDKCQHMWSGMFISTGGNVRTCCVSMERHFKEEISLDAIDDLLEHFNSKLMVNRRKTDINDNRLCTTCTVRNNNKIPSMKDAIVGTYARHGIVPKEDPANCSLEHLEISFSNLCNQQCVMCSSENSSKWTMFDIENVDAGFSRIPTKYRKWTTEKNMNKIKKILHGLKFLVIKGGEPMIQDEVKEILQYIIEHNIEMDINVVTNFQEVSDEMLDILCSLKGMELTFSVDSTNEMYNWSRGGTFDKTIENITAYVKRCDVPKFGWANTLTLWSYKHLIEDIKIIEQINAEIIKGKNTMPWYNILPVVGPRYASPFVDPIEERIEFVFEFEKTFGFITDSSLQYKTLTLNQLDTITSLENELFSPEKIIENRKLSKQWYELVNNIRGTNV